MTTAQKKAIAILAAVLILFAGLGFALGCIVGANADAPNYNGLATLMTVLSDEERVRLLNVAEAERDLGVLRSTNAAPVIMAIYTIDGGAPGAVYYHMVVGPNSSNRALTVTASDGLITQFRVSNTCYDFVWDNSDSGGWVYANTVTGDITCTSLFYYRTNSLGTGTTYNLVNDATKNLSGTGRLGDVAGSWLDAWDVKLNGYHQSGDPLVSYQNGWSDGYTVGYTDGVEDGYESGFDDGVASVPPGENVTIVEKVNFLEAIGAYPLAIRSIFSTGFNLNLGGIVLGSALSVLLITLVLIYVGKKVF